MAPDAIYVVLTDVFADLFQRDVVLTPTLTAHHVADWDSFRQIELILAVEQRFGIKTTSRELDRLQSVGDLVALIEQRTSGRAP